MTIRKHWAIVLFTALVVSIGLNLAIAGFTAARIWGDPRPPPVGGIVAIGIRSFPPEIQQVIRAKSEERRPEIRARLDAVDAARQQMFEALRADPFDPSALNAAFAALRDRTTELQMIGQEMVAEAVSDAPAAVRAEIKPPKRGPRRDDDRRPPPPPEGGPR